jgi:hypothetical protein
MSALLSVVKVAIIIRREMGKLAHMHSLRRRRTEKAEVADMCAMAGG